MTVRQDSMAGDAINALDVRVRDISARCVSRYQDQVEVENVEVLSFVEQLAYNYFAEDMQGELWLSRLRSMDVPPATYDKVAAVWHSIAWHGLTVKMDREAMHDIITEHRECEYSVLWLIQPAIDAMVRLVVKHTQDKCGIYLDQPRPFAVRHDDDGEVDNCLNSHAYVRSTCAHAEATADRFFGHAT